MKTDVEKLDPTRVKLSVEVPFSELEPSLAKAYRTIGGQIRVPGFRPGKVPARIIDARIGRAAVLEQAINDALPRFYGQAVQETGLEPLGQPEVDVTEIDDPNLLKFSVEIDVRPDFDLPSRDALEVTVDAVEVTDADVDEQIDALRERFATQPTVDRTAGDDDLVTIDLVASRDGRPIEGGETMAQTYRIGSGAMIDGLDDALRGLSAGDTATFQTVLVGDQAGREADVTVTVHAVKTQELPDLDDEFAQLASEFDTVDELRADVQTRLSRVKRGEQLVTARDRVLEVYLGRADVAVPSRMLEHELEHRNEAIAGELEMYGLTRDQYLEAQGMSADEFEADTRTKASNAIRAQFVLDALAAQEQLSVDEGELTAHLLNRAQRSGVSPDQYVQQVLQSGNVQGLVGEVVRGKALALLVREANITDSNGAEVDIAALEAELAPPRRVDPFAGQGSDPGGRVTARADEVDESINIDVPFMPDDADRA